jgi:hypothetical protein
MSLENLTPDDLDYVQRLGFDPPGFRPGMPVTEAPIGLRRMLRVEGIGRLARPEAAELSDGAAPSEPATTDLIVGLYNYKVPLAFAVGAESARVAVRLGTWLPSGASPTIVDQNAQILATGLQSLHPVVDVVPDPPVTGEWELGGMVLGIPAPRPAAGGDDVAPLDRLLRALRGTSWSAMVLAQPIDEVVLRDLRLRLINEMRSVQTDTKVNGVPSPLADSYDKLLGSQLETLSQGQGLGAWRTAVYLLGDATGYHRLASLWRGVFSGERSLPEPLRVWDRQDVPMLAASWSMLDPDESAPSPGLYRHLFQQQTLLTSTQLAQYVQLPRLETNGFAITRVPDFDTVPPSVGPGVGPSVGAVTPPGAGATAPAPPLVLGTVVERQHVGAVPYGLASDQLTRHAFVTGTTGSGKTNTVFHLLRQVAGQGTPFLVVEPAKTEYRVLLRDPLFGAGLQVLTLGNENGAPFRLNPFEVPPGIPVGVHLDLLRSVFTASFGMWTPLPQVLESALYGIYADRGWDVTLDANRCLGEGDDRAAAFPTLTDLVRKVEDVVPTLGYEEKVTGDILAALRTRLNSLRTGGKGRMLDVRRSVPVGELVARPTIVELESMGDDDDKAFVMGLLLIRLVEHRRTQGDAAGLRHLLVVEEAHRLLANTSGAARPEEGEGDVRGKAVETFTNLLSEIRAYGQGVVVVDQVPAKLAPDVVKNTNLKVAHRVVAGDDREVLGAAMAMRPHQAGSLATLPVGRAAVFADGQDAPLLVQVPPSKGGTGTWPTLDEVRAQMVRQRIESAAGPLLASDDCDERCLADPRACEVARALVDEPAVRRAFGRCLLSAVLTVGGLERTWPDVAAVVGPRRPPEVDGPAVLRSLARHGARALADRRGARGGWTFGQRASVAALIDRALLAVLDGGSPDEPVAELRAALLALQAPRGGDGLGPFQGCATIWDDRPGPCLCRWPVAEMVAGRGFETEWDDARSEDRARPEGGRPAAWAVCQDVAYQLVEFPGGADPGLDAELADAAQRTALCFGQQMFAAEEWSHAASQRLMFSELLAEAVGEDEDEDEPFDDGEGVVDDAIDDEGADGPDAGADGAETAEADGDQDLPADPVTVDAAGEVDDAR